VQQSWHLQQYCSDIYEHLFIKIKILGKVVATVVVGGAVGANTPFIRFNSASKSSGSIKLSPRNGESIGLN